MVICLERDAGLHMAQLSLASVKSRLVLPFWYRLTRVVPEKGLLNVCVCVCVCKLVEKVFSSGNCDINSYLFLTSVFFGI